LGKGEITMAGPWEDYAQAKPQDASAPWLDYQQSAAPATDTTPPAAQPYQRQPTIGERVKSVAYPVMEAVGAAGGGIIGTGVGPAGTVAGSALGYAGVKGLENIIDQYTGGAQPETLGQAAARTARDVATGATYEMGGQVLGKGASAAAGLFSKSTAPTVQDLKTASSAAYDRAKQSGAVFDMSTTAPSLVQTMQNEGFNASLHPKLSPIFDSITELYKNSAAGKPATVTEVRNFSRLLNKAVRGTADERRIAGMLSDQFDSAIEQFNPRVAADLMEGRDLWGRAARSQQITNIVKKAEASSSPTNEMIKKGMTRLAEKSTGFTPQEKAAIESLSKGDLTTNALATVGKFAPGLTPTGIIKGIGYEQAAQMISPPLALGLAATGSAAKGSANLLAKRSANALAESIRKGTLNIPHPTFAPTLPQRIAPAGLILATPQGQQ
jgi:hypothetical protein